MYLSCDLMKQKKKFSQIFDRAHKTRFYGEMINSLSFR